MNDYEVMLNMLTKAKETNPKIDWACRGGVGNNPKYIWFYRHIFAFNHEGELTDSQGSPELLDLD